MPDDDTILDIDSMSDEEFMKLDPSQMQEVVPDEEEVDPVAAASDDDDPNPEGVGEGDDPAANDEPAGDADPDATPLKEGDEGFVAESEDEPKEVTPEVAEETKEDKTPTPEKGADGEPAKPDAAAEPKATDKAVVKTDSKAAVDFFEKVSAPFKADGRDVTVKSPEDAIRLMQMGVNYSRRMEEMKPLRAQNNMLRTNGLDDPEKLNYMIDLMKGSPAAIKQLLKDHKIDPIDIDTTDETPYQAKNYQGDPKDIAFQDALDETQKAEGGRGLIADINREWDATSKEALRDQPSIFQNILAQKNSGVYSKIKTELEYQKTMGFLKDVPFLQAYHSVGEAMQKAGVFEEKKVHPTPKKVIGTGPRKAAPKPKTEQPTPNVSSATQPRSGTTQQPEQKDEPDFAPMSDEDFLKMAPPS